MKHPIDLLTRWLAGEKQKGAPDPEHVVLSTVTDQAIPHSRVVAIREMTPQGLLFFTHQGTRKAQELRQNTHATMVFWFELCLREVIIEGIVEPLSEAENAQYWKSKSRDAQIRFYTCADMASQFIESKKILEDKKKDVEAAYQNKILSMSPFYCGFRLTPIRIVFYTYRTDEFSDIVEYKTVQGEWQHCRLSP